MHFIDNNLEIAQVKCFWNLTANYIDTSISQLNVFWSLSDSESIL